MILLEKACIVARSKRMNPYQNKPFPLIDETMDLLIQYRHTPDCPRVLQETIEELSEYVTYSHFLETQLEILWETLQAKNKVEMP